MKDKDLSDPKKVLLPLQKWFVEYLREVFPKMKSEVLYLLGCTFIIYLREKIK